MGCDTFYTQMICVGWYVDDLVWEVKVPLTSATLQFEGRNENPVWSNVGGKQYHDAGYYHVSGEETTLSHSVLGWRIPVNDAN